MFYAVSFSQISTLKSCMPLSCLPRVPYVSWCGGQLRIYCISSSGQPNMGGPPAWKLGDVLTTLHRKNLRCYETFRKALNFDSLVRRKRDMRFSIFFKPSLKRKTIKSSFGRPVDEIKQWRSTELEAWGLDLNKSVADRFGVTVTLWIYIPCSNLARIITVPEVFHKFLPTLQANSGRIFRSGHNHFILNPNSSFSWRYVVLGKRVKVNLPLHTPRSHTWGRRHSCTSS